MELKEGKDSKKDMKHDKPTEQKLKTDEYQYDSFYTIIKHRK